MQIDVCVDLPPSLLARLRAGAGDLPVFMLEPDAASKAEIMFGNPDPSVVTGNPALRWLQLESVGFGEYAALEWSRAAGPAQVTNLAGFFADPVAESALAGILALYRGIDRLVLLQQRSEWQGAAIRESFRCLTGARVVLFGMGAINRRLSELLGPFGCAITGFASGYDPAALDQALASADVVVATVPHTPATRGLFGAARLALLPTHAIFCNFGRGSLIDEAALAAALTAGRLGGAVIDVTQEEPLPASHPFWTCPNLLLTQHSGGGSGDEMDRKVEVFLANLRRFRAEEPLAGLVNFSRGY
jgi:phosphoglycerate dehydrogenase-like enzyme